MAVADAGVADAKRVAEDEWKWYRDNPDPKSTPTLEQLTESDEKLTLWNFPVAGADLGPAHKQVLEKFAGPGLMAETPEHPRMDFYVEGHASVTGRETSNRDYAEERAKNVAAFLTGLGIQKVRFESAGSSQPEIEGTDPQALARNRRVVVMRSLSTYPVVPPPPPPQQPPPAAGPTGSTVQVIVPINLALSPLQAPGIVIAPFVIGDLKVAVRAGDPLRAGVTTTSEAKPALTRGFRKGPGNAGARPAAGRQGGHRKGRPGIDQRGNRCRGVVPHPEGRLPARGKLHLLQLQGGSRKSPADRPIQRRRGDPRVQRQHPLRHRAVGDSEGHVPIDVGSGPERHRDRGRVRPGEPQGAGDSSDDHGCRQDGEPARSG